MSNSQIYFIIYRISFNILHSIYVHIEISWLVCVKNAKELLIQNLFKF